MYYVWRDEFLETDKKELVNGAGDSNANRAEIEKLQKIIGKQAVQIEISKEDGRFAGDKIILVASLKEAGYTLIDAYQELGISRNGYYGLRQPKVLKGVFFGHAGTADC